MKLTALAILLSVACAACHSAPPIHVTPLVYPDPRDIMRGATVGIAVVPNRSDVLGPLYSYEYVVFPTRASLWTPTARWAPTATVKQAPNVDMDPPGQRERQITSVIQTPATSSATIWRNYCNSSSSLTFQDWQVIDGSHLPQSLTHCCKTGCKG